MATCDWNALQQQAKCLECLSEQQLLVLLVQLYCQILNSVNPSAFLDFDFIAELRGQSVVPGMLYAMVNMETVEGDGSAGGWFWRPTSLEDDDGASVAKPDSLSDVQPGRWHKHFGG